MGDKTTGICSRGFLGFYVVPVVFCSRGREQPRNNTAPDPLIWSCCYLRNPLWWCGGGGGVNIIFLKVGQNLLLIPLLGYRAEGAFRSGGPQTEVGFRCEFGYKYI